MTSPAFPRRSLAACAASLCVSIAAVASRAEPAPRPDPQTAQVDNRSIHACNRTAERISVAKAATTGQTENGRPVVLSEGWWTVEPGACIRLWGPGIVQRYHYVFAENAQRNWAGTYPVCVTNQRFRIADNQCAASHQRRMFRQIDMQGVRGDFTMNFNY